MSDLAQYIDHTLLKPDATRGQLETLCAEAAEHNFATVCVNGSRVELSHSLLELHECFCKYLPGAQTTSGTVPGHGW